MPIAGKKTFLNIAILMWVATVVLICSWIGCRKRDVSDPTRGMHDSERYQIKVLLFDNIRKCTLKAENGFEAVDADTSVKASFVSDKAYEVSVINGRISVGEHVFNKCVLIEPKEPYVFGVADSDNEIEKFRGNLSISLSSEGEELRLVNKVPIEAYLNGVVGAEMPSHWESESLNAQAVVSRTYSLFCKQKYGTNREWDVRRTEASQVYKGVQAESLTVRKAIDSTKGQVLVFSENGGEADIFPTYFSSTCGGYTESGDNVFRESSGALASIKCDYCRGLTRSSFFTWGNVEYKMSEVSQKLIEHYPTLKRLNSIVDVKAAEVSKFEDFERLKTVKLIGKNGQSQTLEAENFRLTLDPTGRKLKSTGCIISTRKGKLVFSKGRGFGHGVGMCQYGAHGQARKGKKYDEILLFYYPGSKIKRLY